MIMKVTKKLSSANKESIICGWKFINNKLKKYKTNFIPLDSEHFSIWSLIKKNLISQLLAYLDLMVWIRHLKRSLIQKIYQALTKNQ